MFQASEWFELDCDPDWASEDRCALILGPEECTTSLTPLPDDVEEHVEAVVQSLGAV